jgi:hypothetical protein
MWRIDCTLGAGLLLLFVLVSADTLVRDRYRYRYGSPRFTVRWESDERLRRATDRFQNTAARSLDRRAVEVAAVRATDDSPGSAAGDPHAGRAADLRVCSTADVDKMRDLQTVAFSLSEGGDLYSVWRSQAFVSGQDLRRWVGWASLSGVVPSRATVANANANAPSFLSDGTAICALRIKRRNPATGDIDINAVAVVMVPDGMTLVDEAIATAGAGTDTGTGALPECLRSIFCLRGRPLCTVCSDICTKNRSGTDRAREDTCIWTRPSSSLAGRLVAPQPVDYTVVETRARMCRCLAN